MLAITTSRLASKHTIIGSGGLCTNISGIMTHCIGTWAIHTGSTQSAAPHLMHNPAMRRQAAGTDARLLGQFVLDLRLVL